MIAYNTLNGNVDKIQEIIESLEKEKGTWSNAIYTDAAVKMIISDKLEEAISTLKSFKTYCENKGSKMDKSIKSE